MPAIDPKPFFQWNQSRLLADIRPAGAFRKGSLRSAISIPADDFSNTVEVTDQLRAVLTDKPLHLIDLDGRLAAEIALQLPADYLEGGYKGFRKWRDEVFERGPQICILGGYTGSGKTVLLQELQRSGEQVIDLETLALHKGSVFGEWPQKPQPLHEDFQNELLSIWLALDQTRPLWLEEKGPFLGRAGLPAALHERMKQAPVFHLEVPFEERLVYILKEYHHLQGSFFRKALKSLEPRMGVSQNHKALHYHDSGQREKCFELLLQYYDQAYDQRRENLWTGVIIPVEHRHDRILETVKKLKALA